VSAQSLSVALPISQRVPQILSTGNHLTLEPVRGFMILVWVRRLRSGELARLTGVSADTLRHYERMGILPASQRTNDGYRTFPSSAAERVQLAQRALQLGFSLKELSEIFRIHDNGVSPVNGCSICQRKNSAQLGGRFGNLSEP
jgi:DNA-binding transcriptional MerR regulator